MNKIDVDIKRTEDATGTVWLVYGSRLMIRVLVTRVLKHEGKFDEEGNQVYEVFHHTQIVTKPPRN